MFEAIWSYHFDCWPMILLRVSASSIARYWGKP
jgi:hypothetical protein